MEEDPQRLAARTTLWVNYGGAKDLDRAQIKGMLLHAEPTVRRAAIKAVQERASTDYHVRFLPAT